MIKVKLEFKQDTIRKVLNGKIPKTDATSLLGCKIQTIYRLLEKANLHGLDALKDNRHSNNYKLTPKQLLEVIKEKRDGAWRSARKVLEITNVSSVSTRRVQQIWVENGLNQMNVERLKPITRFVAREPNDLCQADIQRKMHFPYLGEAVKNDQPYIEWQNYSVVRRFVGYGRLDIWERLEVLNKPYRKLSDYQNFFQPVMRLKEKVRNEAHVTRKYGRAKTAYQRVLENQDIPAEVKQNLTERFLNLNPRKLILEINALARKVNS